MLHAVYMYNTKLKSTALYLQRFDKQSPLNNVNFDKFLAGSN